jgi:hypothetical protein
MFQAIQHGCSDDILLAILNVNKGATKKRNSSGRLLLDEVIACKRSDRVLLTVLRANPNATRSKVPIIFQALQHNYSENVLLAILDANVSAAKSLSSSGRLLLHEAIITGCSERVIMKIFHLYPWAAMIRCKQTGKLPLHFAAASSSQPTIVEALIRMYPEALDTECLKDKYRPKDYITSALPTKSIEMICKPYSKWMKQISDDDSKIDGKLDIFKQLKSDVAYLSKEFSSFSKSDL